MLIIEIHEAEVEEIIHQRLQGGAFKDAQEVISAALRSIPPDTSTAKPHPEAEDMVELFAPLRGLNLNFERNREIGGDVDL